MKVHGMDERMVAEARLGGNFVVFIYEGGEGEPHSSWAVDSYLLTDVDLPGVLTWLGDNLPAGCCWSLGVVEEPEHPTAEQQVRMSWVVGGDVLNYDPSKLDAEEQRLASEMLARRHRVTFD
jgi:hypothetical protein